MGGSIEPVQILADVARHAAGDVGLIAHDEVTEPLVVLARGCAVVGVIEGGDHGFLPCQTEGVGEGPDGGGGGVEEEAPAVGGIELGQIVEHLIGGQGLIDLTDTELLGGGIQGILGPEALHRGGEGGHEVAHAAVDAVEVQILGVDVAAGLGIVEEEIGVGVPGQEDKDEDPQPHEDTEDGDGGKADLEEERRGTGHQQGQHNDTAQNEHGGHHEQDAGHIFQDGFHGIGLLSAADGGGKQFMV